MAVCSAHGYAGSIASPGGGPLSFRACSKASTAIATAVAVATTAAVESPPSPPPPYPPPPSSPPYRRRPRRCPHRHPHRHRHRRAPPPPQSPPVRHRHRHRHRHVPPPSPRVQRWCICSDERKWSHARAKKSRRGGSEQRACGRAKNQAKQCSSCLLYTSPSPRDS